MPMDIDMADLANMFIEESREGLDIMESGLLNLDLGAADPETMNAIFRAAHSIKGGGATFGFLEISEFAHHAETLLDQMRQGARPVTQAGVDLLLKSVDILREMMEMLADGEVDTTNANAVQAELEHMSANPGAEEAPSAASPPAADDFIDLTAEPDEAPAGAADGWKITFEPHASMLRSCNDPLRMLRELGDLGALKITTLGADTLKFGEFDPEECQLSWVLELAGDASRDAIEEVFAWVTDECDLTIEQTKIDVPETATAAAEPAAAAVAEVPKPAPEKKPPASSKGKSSGGESGSIRVNTEKVDALINLVGELVITQSMLSRYHGEFDLEETDGLRDGLAQLSRNTRELQESVMAIRMLPISFAFSRFPRLVRDISNSLGKKVDLQLTGENTELDKTVLEKIGDPLVHLVRNSMDHGLESPEKRLAAGKPETGVLNLNAYHESGNIVIEVIDDGAGINQEKVLAKARERGLVGPDEQLPPERINNLIFMAGFSTADEVSDLSGRGVGMDVVRRNIADLGGQVSVASEPGVGSQFTIRLPLTLAILDGQLVKVGGETYIVPLVSILETIQVKDEQVRSVAGKADVFRLRDEYLPVVPLHGLFGVQNARENVEDGLLVVTEANGQRVGILVDELAEQQQVVIKSLDSSYQHVAGVSGATILGSGDVALIVDVAELIALFEETQNLRLSVRAAVA